MIIDGFVPCTGQHCETTATGNLLKHSGLNLSEPMLFGGTIATSRGSGTQGLPEDSTEHLAGPRQLRQWQCAALND